MRPKSLSRPAPLAPSGRTRSERTACRLSGSPHPARPAQTCARRLHRHRCWYSRPTMAPTSPRNPYITPQSIAGLHELNLIPVRILDKSQDRPASLKLSWLPGDRAAPAPNLFHRFGHIVDTQGNMAVACPQVVPPPIPIVCKLQKRIHRIGADPEENQSKPALLDVHPTQHVQPQNIRVEIDRTVYSLAPDHCMQIAHSSTPLRIVRSVSVSTKVLFRFLFHLLQTVVVVRKLVEVR